MSIEIEISYGELIDKITILEIKFERIADADKRANVERELAVLHNAWMRAGISPGVVEAQRRQLKDTNEKLWVIEDAIREKEAAGSFDQEFIELARSVYVTNDERAAFWRARGPRV